ncbi:DUF4129 domain-containing protein [Chloroflexota bacterium]
MPEISEVTQMTQKTKYFSLIFLAVALVSLILLAASLSNLQLKPGTPFPSGGNSDNVPQSVPAIPAVQTYSLPILQGVFALIFVILMISVLARLTVLENLKKILWLILAMVILFILTYMTPDTAPGESIFFPNESPQITIPPSTNYSFTPLGQPPQELIWLVIIALVLSIGFLAFKILKRPYSMQLEDQLLQEAEFAVNALKSGMDLRNVIIHCYFEMTRSLKEEQGIERSHNTTAQEFGEWLELKGFPPVPVHQLTYLFEKARYGKGQMSNNDEKTAVESLDEIIQFCRNEKEWTGGQNQ